MPGAVSVGTNAVGAVAAQGGAPPPRTNAVGAVAAQGGAPPPRTNAVAVRAANGDEVVWQNANVSDSYEDIFRVIEPVCSSGRGIRHPQFNAAVDLLEKTFNLPFKINRKIPIDCANDTPVPAEAEEGEKQEDLDAERTSGWRRGVVDPEPHADNNAFYHGLNPMAVQGTIVEDLFGGAKATPVYIDGNNEQCATLVGGRVVARAWDPNHCTHYAISPSARSRNVIVVWFYRHRSPKEARDFINKSRAGVYVRDTAKLTRLPGRADVNAHAWEDANNGAFTRPGVGRPPPQDCISWKLPKKRSSKWRDIIYGAWNDVDVFARAFVDISQGDASTKAERRSRRPEPRRHHCDPAS